MQAKNVNQFGKNSIFIEKNNGNVYITERYVEETTSAFIKVHTNYENTIQQLNQLSPEKK